MTITVAMAEELGDELLCALNDDVETVFVLSCRRVDTAGATTLLVRDAFRVPNDAYLDRTFDRARVDAEGWFPALGRAENDGCGVVFCHTHPGGEALVSDRDRVADDLWGPSAAERTTAGWYGSIILAGRSASPAITGRFWDGDDDPIPVHRLRIVGRRLRIVEDGVPVDLAVHDRDIRAYGEAGARQLASLRVGIVGNGGTGSPLATQLARLGVRDFVFVDPDVVDESNLSRIDGSDPSLVGIAKVHVAEANVRRIRGLDAAIRTVAGTVTDRAVAAALVDRDVVFGCTDDHAGRGVLCRFPVWMLIPVIDCGVVIDSTSGVLELVAMRVTRLSVGDPCLWCGGWIDPQIAAAERLNPDEHARLALDGYVRDLDEPAPSVVAYTMMTASLVVHALFDLCFGIRSTTGQTTIVLLGDDLISTSLATPRSGHFCVDHSHRASGATDPFLGILW